MNSRVSIGIIMYTPKIKFLTNIFFISSKSALFIKFSLSDYCSQNKDPFPTTNTISFSKICSP